MFQNSPNSYAVYACNISVICLGNSSFILLIDLHDHATDQIDSLSIPFVANEIRTGLKGPNIMTKEGPAKDQFKRKSSGSKGRRKIQRKTIRPRIKSYFLPDKQSVYSR